MRLLVSTAINDVAVLVERPVGAQFVQAHGEFHLAPPFSHSAVELLMGQSFERDLQRLHHTRSSLALGGLQQASRHEGGDLAHLGHEEILPQFDYGMEGWHGAASA